MLTLSAVRAARPGSGWALWVRGLASICCVLGATGVSRTATAGPTGWQLEVHAGSIGSGRLFEAMSDISRSWPTPEGPVEGIRLRAEVGEQVMGGMRATLGLSPRIALQLSGSASQLGITSQALTEGTRNVYFYDYDKMTAILVDLVLVARLTQLNSHPYLVAGGGLSVLNFSKGNELDQTKPDILVGLGYHWEIDPAFALEFDLRDALCWPSASDAPASSLAQTFKEASPMHLWQATVGVSLNL